MQKLYIFLGNAVEQRYHKFYYYTKRNQNQHFNLILIFLIRYTMHIQIEIDY